MNLSKVQIVVIGAVLLGAGYLGYTIFTNDSDTVSPAQVTEESSQEIQADSEEPLSPNDEIELENQDEVNTPRPEEGDPSKTPVTVVTEKPLIYTGYGHNELKPLPSGQATSTTCTTDPNVECQVIASKVGSGDVFTFDAITTNSEGVARWTWTGGTELSSGAWELVATAGDKSSDKETIYVQ